MVRLNGMKEPSKVDQIRRMREAREVERLSRQEGDFQESGGAAGQLTAAETSGVMSGGPSTGKPTEQGHGGSNPSLVAPRPEVKAKRAARGTFDRRSYQREYMRKKRRERDK